MTKTENFYIKASYTNCVTQWHIMTINVVNKIHNKSGDNRVAASDDLHKA